MIRASVAAGVSTVTSSPHAAEIPSWTVMTGHSLRCRSPVALGTVIRARNGAFHNRRPMHRGRGSKDQVASEDRMVS